MDRMFQMAHHIPELCTHQIEVIVGAWKSNEYPSGTQSFDTITLTKLSILVQRIYIETWEWLNLNRGEGGLQRN